MGYVSDKATRTVTVKLAPDEFAWIEARRKALSRGAEPLDLMARNRGARAVTVSSFVRLLVQNAMGKARADVSAKPRKAPRARKGR